MRFILFFNFIALGFVSFEMGAKPPTLDSLRKQAQEIYVPSKNGSGWPANTTVYAATLQERLSYMNDEFGDFHYRQLKISLQKSEVRNLYEAHVDFKNGSINPSIKEGEPIVQIPVISHEGTPGWIKSERRPRTILFVLGDGRNPARLAKNPLEQAKITVHDQEVFLKSANLFKETLMKTYEGLTDVDFRVIQQPTLSELESELLTLKKFAEANPAAEAMIAFFGHGVAAAPQSTSSGKRPQTTGFKQGAYNGKFALKGLQMLDEDGLKNGFKVYLSKFSSVAFINTACQSGAWVAGSDVMSAEDIPALNVKSAT